MAATSIKEERAALADTLRTLDSDLSVYPYWVEQWESPAMIIKPQDYNMMAMDGEVYRDYIIEILILLGELEDCQITLDEYLEDDGDKSVRELLDGNPTLGGRVGNSDYMGWTEYGGRRSEGTNFVGAKCHIRIYA